MDTRRRNIIIVVVILASFAISIGSLSTIYTGGWEVQANLSSVRVNQQSYDSANQPENVYSWGGAYMSFDVDDETTGVPDLKINLGAPVEYVTEGGEWVQARDGESFKDIKKEIGDDVYFFEHHVFFFEMLVVAEGDYETARGVFGECKGMYNAEEARLSTFVLFDAGLWNVKSSFESENGEATYAKADVWTGVMSASITEADGGYVKEPPDDFDGYPGRWSVTNVGRLNMFLLDGSEEGESSISYYESQPSEIEGVPSEVIVEVGDTTLQPGWWWPYLGSISTYAVQATYRLRVDVVTSARYTFAQGDQDDEVGDPDVSDEGSAGPLVNLRRAVSDAVDSLASPRVLIVTIVVIVAVAYVVPKLLRREVTIGVG